MSSETEEKLSILESFEDQDDFVKAALGGAYKFLLYAGDIRSGKTIICLAVLVCLCKIYPQSRWCVMREDRPKLIRNTLPTFFKFCCPLNFLREFNKSELSVKFKNGSEIFFMAESFQDDQEMKKMDGLEVNGFLLDQVEELRKLTFNKAVMRAGQWNIDPMPPTLILMDANPTNNWVKTVFYDAWAAGTMKPPFYFQIADINKNPYISEEYKNDLKTTLPPEVYKRYCEHQWEAIDEIMQLNPWEAIYSCKEKIKSKSKRKWMGVDVGREGPDPSLWFVIEGNNILTIEAIDKTKIPEVTRKTEEMMLKYSINAEDICVDAVGIGGGVVDELEEKKIYVISMKGGTPCGTELAGTNFTFANHRSWSNWIAAQLLKDHKIGNFNHQTLVSDAGAIKYNIKNDKSIYIQSKDEFRIKTGRSSDYWDGYTYAVWAKLQDELIPLPGVVLV